MKTFNPQIWQSAAEDTLAVLLTEQYTDAGQNAFNHAVHENGLMPYHVPAGKWRALMAGICDLRMQKRAVNWNNLATVVNDQVTQAWYTELVTLSDPLRAADFRDNVQLLVEFGNRSAVVESLEQAAENIKQGEPVEQSVNLLISDITTVGEVKIQNETAGGSAARLAAIFDQAPPPVVKTGVPFVDDAIGGLRDERMLVLAGAYKSRKTTLMLNWIMTAMRAGKSPAVLSWENTIAMTEMQFIAMLAVEYLLQSERVPYSADAPLYWISADGLMQAGIGYKAWTKLKVEAIDYARAEFLGWGDRLRIYDRSATGGNLSDIQSVRSVIRRDMRLYGGNLYGIDHQGLIDASGEVYEHTRSVSKELQGISRISDPHPISLIVLAQLNESAIANGGGYSAGVKGGGDTSANADYVLRTTPMSVDGGGDKYHDDRIELQVKHNRWGASTAKQTVMFHPESGLHMPHTTVKFSDLAEKAMVR